ncbi:valine--tRNA ligase [Myxococcota bacterium]
MSELPKAYDPSHVEPRWYQFWLDQGVFRASDDPKDQRIPYTISMPPPNVTGSLHMGHALFGTIQDVLIRHRRMQGRNALWQPGIDHAGIATQTVVERQLKREGLTRQELGREAFIRRVWQWKEASGGRISEQMRVLGCSADWERLKFTMDPDLSYAVREAFVRLYEQGLIYRATRLVNWDVESQTVLSDLEVDAEEDVLGELYEFAYPVVDGDPSRGTTELVVATTRPETMLGDTAVAVHPDDARYRHLHGKRVQHPFLPRQVPIITDDILVDMAFGTGAVKVTPAHDYHDFATGKRHGLEEINILHLDGTLNEQAGEFAGLDRWAAREAVKQRLSELGLARGSRPHKMTLPRSQRTDTVVEPMVSTQWFLRTRPLAEPALQAVRDGRTEIVPSEWVKTYEHWLTNIQDWCISRQLWWGHPIPAFHCQTCGEVLVTRADQPERCSKCESSGLQQDPDVLDTWFSSALWPFSTLGWPNDTPALRRFYPSSDMETGYDILFFWVARMMMLGLHFMGDVPFRRILLHGMVVDENGAKMSKVKGNTLDPLDVVLGADFTTVVQKSLPGAPVGEALAKFKQAYPSSSQMGTGFPAFGADALRMTLSSYSPQAKRIALSPKRIEGYRNFCNKMYNAVRYALGHWGQMDPESLADQDFASTPPVLLANRWILSRLAAAIQASNQGIDDFRLDEASGSLYHFFWDELCDWYLELSKVAFSQGTEAEKGETRLVLAHVIETALRALHPFMPFITEELWQRVPRPSTDPVSVALAPYPSAVDARPDALAEVSFAVVMAVVMAGRSARSEHNVAQNAAVPLIVRMAHADLRAMLSNESRFVQALVRTEGPLRTEEPGGTRPPGMVLDSVISPAGPLEVLVGLKGLVDPRREGERIERGLKKAKKECDGLAKRLSQPSFVEKAPCEVVAQKNALEQQIRRLEEVQGLLEEL